MLINEYIKRFPRTYRLQIIEVNIPRKVNIKNRMQHATQKLLDAVPKDSLVIALDEQGKEFTTIELAQKLTLWQEENREISLLIGGADGLDKSYLQKLPMVWSLSRLTLPHQMVRTLLVEQLYRAWTIINGHPYHRN